MPRTFAPVSWQRMADAVENVRRRLLRAFAALDGAGVPYAVVGGNAVAAWVSRADEAAVPNTRDVDILLRREDLPAATAALSAAGFIHRRLSSLGQPGTMDVFMSSCPSSSLGTQAIFEALLHRACRNWKQELPKQVRYQAGAW